MAIYGHKPEEVIAKIKSRLNGKKVKDAIIGLVGQAGVLRCIYNGGGCVALQLKDGHLIFDQMVGASGATFNNEYFASGQAPLGLSIYYENGNTRRFINFLRPRRVMDLGYLVDQVMRQEKPLDIKALRANPAKIYAQLTNAINGQGEVLPLQGELDPHLIAKAGATFPGLCLKPEIVQGTPYFDGGLSDILPIKWLLNQGCTDILVLANVPANYRRLRHISANSMGMPNLVLPLVKNILGERLFRQYLKTPNRYNQTLDLVFGVTPPSKGVNIATIAPSTMPKSFNKSPRYLKAMAQAGADDLCKAFGWPKQPIPFLHSKKRQTR